MSDSMMVFGDYVYLDPTEHIFTFEKTQLPEKFQQIQNLSKYGYLLGYVSYEAGLFAEKSLKNMKTPLLEFFFFQKRYPVLEFQQNSLQKQAVFCPKILQNLNETSYAKGFDTIKKNLKKGNTYQVNFTQEIHLQTTCEGMEIFLSLLKQQNTAYKAYLKTPFVEIISFSPELFFQIKNDEIILEPMKGTIKRGSNEEEDDKKKAIIKIIHDLVVDFLL
ncbi:MAG: chorismate-binding protein, partial [Helicobacter sp.]|nr:chorismate-binding protein [Helicobacter sp.]